jgi:hypothetical protein
MMMTEMDIETSVHYVHLTRLIAREDYIKHYMVSQPRRPRLEILALWKPQNCKEPMQKKKPVHVVWYNLLTPWQLAVIQQCFLKCPVSELVNT